MSAPLKSEPQCFRPNPETQRDLRNAFGSFPTGITVITTNTPNGPVGVTANSFSSVSLDPPLVLWCIDKASDRLEYFQTAERYAIHVLSEEQETDSTGFARSAFHCDTAEWAPGTDDIPELAQYLARFDCRLDAAHDAGDHIILVGEVLEIKTQPGQPLLYIRGGYGRISG